LLNFVNQQLNKEVKKIYDSIRYPRKTIWKKPFYKVEFHISFWEKIDEKKQVSSWRYFTRQNLSLLKKEKSDECDIFYGNLIFPRKK